MIIDTPYAVPDRADCDRLLETLPSLPLAARAAVVERLMRNASPDIRDRALRIGAAVLSDSRLTELLRADDDAVMRNAGSEILLLRGSRSLTAVLPLLHDRDPDVVLQAVLILDRLHDPRALEPLHGILVHPDPNVVQETILAIGRLGDGRSVPHLLPFLDADLWLQMAALQALGDLRCAAGIEPLARRVADPVVGSLAAESLARIGGPAVFTVLADTWDAAPGDELDEDRAGLLAHVLEGLPAPPESTPAGFRDKLMRCLRGGPEGSRQSSAARSLLCLGPGPWDEEALAVLVASQPPAEFPPEPLRRRPDLTGRLLRGGEAERSWGFLLAAQNPDQIWDREVSEAFRAAVEAAGHGDEPVSAALVAALGRVRFPGLGGVLVDLYLRLPAEQRAALEAGLSPHAAAVWAAAATRSGLDPLARLRLAALGGEPAAGLAAQLLALPAPSRREAAAGLVHLEELMRRLPWEEWLGEAPELFTDLAADVAARYALRGLAAPLRKRLAAAPSPAVIRALGELGDRDSGPELIRLAGRRPDLTSVLLEALGRIGGAAAREVLRRVALAGGPDARIGFKALAACHEAAELPLFRDAAAHSDWFIRLAAAEVLARSAVAEDVGRLARLVGDPVAVVAQRALALLEAGREARP
jgi:hypothetical protein